MPSNKQSRACIFFCATTICLAFGFLLASCLPSSKVQAFPTITPIITTLLTPTKQLSVPTVQPQAFISTPSTKTTISLIVTFGKFDSDVKKVVISDDGKILAAVGGKNDQLTVWNVDSGKELLTLKDDNDWNFALSADGHLLASTTGSDSWITIRDTQTGQKLQKIKDTRIAQGLAFSPDGNVLAVGGNSLIWFWNIQNNTLVDYLGPQSNFIGALAFSSDGRQLVSVGDYAIQLWDLSSRKALKTFRLSRYHLYWGASISPGNPDYIAIPYESVLDQNSAFYLDKNSVEIWNITKGNIIRTITEFGASGTPMAISPDGRFLAVAQTTQTEIWDVSSGKPVYKFQPDWAVFAFSTYGNRLVVGNLNGTVEIWDTSRLK